MSELTQHLREIEMRLEAATIPPNAFEVLYRMGYDSDKEPYCRLIAHAPTDLTRLLSALRLCVEQRDAWIRVAWNLESREDSPELSVEPCNKALAEILNGGSE